MDATARPMPTAKAWRANETPAAPIAPAKMADHSMRGRANTGSATALTSAQPEEGQDGQDDDDKAYQIDHTVHGSSHASGRKLNVRDKVLFRCGPDVRR